MRRSTMFYVLVATAFCVLPVSLLPNSVLPKGEDAGLKPRRYITGEDAGPFEAPFTKFVQGRQGRPFDSQGRLKPRRYIKGSGDKQNQEKAGALARQGTKMAPDAKSVTIEGAVRDLACPIQNPAGTATSFSLQCNLDCVKHGSPIIILTKDGVIYFPISRDMPDSDQREKMMPFVGKYVQASGPVFERNGTHAIAITEIKELKNVHIEDAAE